MATTIPGNIIQIHFRARVLVALGAADPSESVVVAFRVLLVALLLLVGNFETVVALLAALEDAEAARRVFAALAFVVFVGTTAAPSVFDSFDFGDSGLRSGVFSLSATESRGTSLVSIESFVVVRVRFVTFLFVAEAGAAGVGAVPSVSLAVT